MKQALDLLRNAPPYLVFLVALVGAVSFGLMKLAAVLQTLQG